MRQTNKAQGKERGKMRINVCLQSRQDPSFRLCKVALESICNIVAGCKVQARTMYTERHNQVAGIVYRNIWALCGLKVFNPSSETTHKVVENNRAKVLWDIGFQTPRPLVEDQSRRNIHILKREIYIYCKLAYSPWDKD